MPRKKETYESLMSELEKILEDMDNNELSLDKSIKYYENGVKISNKLYKLLNDAESKIKILMDNEEKDFVNEEE